MSPNRRNTLLHRDCTEPVTRVSCMKRFGTEKTLVLTLFALHSGSGGSVTHNSFYVYDILRKVLVASRRVI